jgi:transcriptional regulator with XRE-family HTH domain
MSGKKKWSETRDARFRRTPEARARYDENARRFRERLQGQIKTLAELRRARRFTQQQLASVMHVSQAQISRVENQTDLYLSTLRGYIEALGGELEIRVRLPRSEWVEVSIGDVTGAQTQPTAPAEVAFAKDLWGSCIGSLVVNLHRGLERSAAPMVIWANQGTTVGELGRWAVEKWVQADPKPTFDLPRKVYWMPAARSVQVGLTGSRELHSSVGWIPNPADIRVPDDPADLVTWSESKKGEVSPWA